MKNVECKSINVIFKTKQCKFIMSFKEINALRKEGKLIEALQMVNMDLQHEPENIWIKRAASWVYYAYIKENTKSERFDVFLKYLQKLKDLNLQDDDRMIFDKVAWRIGSMVYSIQKEKQIDFSKLDAIFNVIREFHFSAPSECYSFLFKSFLKLSDNWHRFIDFADWWNLENFRPEDYQVEELNNHRLPSLVERAYMAYARKLLDGGPVVQSGFTRAIDKEKIMAVIPMLDHLIEKNPDFIYLPYYMAKLLLLMGDEDEALSAFIPFAKKKRNDFWVWNLLAEIFHDDENFIFACYCMALSLRNKEEFLVKTRQAFAAILLKMGMYNEAKTEIDIIVKTRLKNQWGIPQQISEWMEEDWFKSAITKQNNSDLYMLHKLKAEEILFRDNPKEIVVVVFVNKNKKVINFVRDKQISGYFTYSGLIDHPKVGDIITVQFNGKLKNGFNMALTVKKCQVNMDTEAFKTFKGNFEKLPKKEFGFCDQIYIEPELLNDLNLNNGDLVSGTAIISFNKKREKWSWRAIKIEKNESTYHIS
jgi:tetratricopeptide (TPR) repeat protein